MNPVLADVQECSEENELNGSVTITAYQPLPDDTPIQQALDDIKGFGYDRLPDAEPLTAHIPHKFVGELTGAISGQVWCYGYAIHAGICVYVNMGGPSTSVEAIRAKLGLGQSVSVIPHEGGKVPVELTAGERNSGMYVDYQAHMPEAKFRSVILVHRMAIEPDYSGTPGATTFIFHQNDTNSAAKLLHHVTELVFVPVFDTWKAFLYTAGFAAGLVHNTRAAGGIRVLRVSLDRHAWTRLIAGGLYNGSIALPAQ